MNLRELGRSGIRVPTITFGGTYLVGQWIKQPRLAC